jgi:hypothetical protein
MRSAYPATVATLMILAVLGLGMWLSFPNWDDAWLSLLVKEHGLGAVIDAVPDRPLAAHLMKLGMSVGLIPMIVISLLLWLALGILSKHLLSIFFPTLSGLWPLCLILTISPVLVQTHMFVFNGTLTALLSVVLAYTGMLGIMRFSKADEERPYLLFSALLLFVVGILISEYAVPCAIATFVALFCCSSSDELRIRRIKTSALLLLCTFLSYAFIALRSRQDTSPTFAFDNLHKVLMNLPFTLVGSVWEASLGSFFEGLASINQISLQNRPSFIGMALACAIAALLIAASQNGNAPTLRSIACVSLCVLAAILPVAMMARIPYPGGATRYLLPVVPLSSILIVGILSKAFVEKSRILGSVLVALACSGATISYVYREVQTQRTLSSYSEKLKQVALQNDGLIVAIVPVDAADYALTGSITKAWPVNLSERFWAVSANRARTTVGGRDCISQNFSRNVRLVSRNGQPSRLLEVLDDGSLVDYCKRPWE